MVYTKQEKKVLDTLVKKINGFDLYYEMSDSTNVYNLGHSNKNKIILKMKNLFLSEKYKLYSKLNEKGKICWDRYFKIY